MMRPFEPASKHWDSLKTRNDIVKRCMVRLWQASPVAWHGSIGGLLRWRSSVLSVWSASMELQLGDAPHTSTIMQERMEYLTARQISMVVTILRYPVIMEGPPVRAEHMQREISELTFPAVTASRGHRLFYGDCD